MPLPVRKRSSRRDSMPPQGGRSWRSTRTSW